MIPISVVRLGAETESLVLDVIRSGIIAQGPKVAELESRFAELVGAEHAVAVNNGTTALVAALQVLDLEPGDEVITSPFTFVATLNAILEAGATARFGDIAVEDFNLTADSVRENLTPRTKVLMPVHLYGQTADMTALGGIAAERGLALVEDAAQAHGARFEGRGAGSFGTGCFSFYATKNLTTGEGGMITTGDADLADRLRVLRNQGMRARYEYEMAGHNYRMTDLQAAVALPQLGGYAGQLDRRRANAARLAELLGDVDGLVLPQQLPGREHVWHQFTVLLPAEHAERREQIIDALRDEHGVGSGIYYPRTVFDYDCYRDREDVVVSDTPVADDVVRRCLSLPVHAYLSDDDVVTVATALRAVLS
ncbi:DegT/DnrJ/EryC1/StrS aminotransferase [Beutenbergia cavernae DSM 12333]|uniref:DegT/DnrJ/EryC1/StrS aminotransferase n=1 Tax=Beutenbergia cavernae (strain ATCC BAA-8 / DSM 12333 / CCUG 43141 / JCM 11478 / NBRC 16432 / NCIMB 13614 / HKI 0122) TaxID=471853 RepID=C5C140_BEUC1|nr:DegT/DnrJ/EryC1/StrS family aminotransferase [Beutenbergia cavernae]ACQ79444.1 DegT/DnrJ/EryC1/StrS aminotransferase [Beutenbergia cavernae DSM 12333]